MEKLSLILVAVGLAMDACAISMAKGMTLPATSIKKYALRYGIVFGLFQGLMPLFGYLAGHIFAQSIQSIDHWLAFILLSIVGFNMIKESKESKNQSDTQRDSFVTLFILGVATSLDACAVGVSFAFLQVDIIDSCVMIGMVTFVLSSACVLLGRRIGNVFQKYAEVTGGIILIGLGIKILIEHLFM